MRRSTVFSLLTCLMLIPLTLYLGTHLKGRWYYLTSTLVLFEIMLPFFFSFETRKPQARELVLIAVMSALAVASRVVIPIPGFKPVTAIVMLAGIALGAEAGFVTGAIAAFASNFFLSQGPWTPWQMMAYGFGGYVAGMCFFQKNRSRSPLSLAVFGTLTILLAVGPLLSCCTLFTTGSRLSWRFARMVFLAGLPENTIHSAACGLTMLLFGRPLLKKLDRVIQKYGMMDVRREE